MRPLPVESLTGPPAYVLGVAIIRGAPVPVVDVAALVGAGDAEPERLVTVRAEGRVVALVVDAVLGVRWLPSRALRELSPLLRGAPGDAVHSIGALGAELVIALESARVIPDSLWRSLEDEGGERVS